MSNKNKKLKIVKIVVFVVTILLMIGMTIYLFPVMKNLSTYEGQIAFREKVNNSGIFPDAINALSFVSYSSLGVLITFT